MLVEGANRFPRVPVLVVAAWDTIKESLSSLEKRVSVSNAFCGHGFRKKIWRLDLERWGRRKLEVSALSDWVDISSIKRDPEYKGEARLKRR